MITIIRRPRFEADLLISMHERFIRRDSVDIEGVMIWTQWRSTTAPLAVDLTQSDDRELCNIYERCKHRGDGIHRPLFTGRMAGAYGYTCRYHVVHRDQSSLISDQESHRDSQMPFTSPRQTAHSE